MPDEKPLQAMIPKAKEDYGGNHVMLEIAPNVFALYAHLHPGILTVKVGDAVKAGAPLGKVGNTGPSNGPHLHFGLSNKPDFFAGRSLPFVFDSYTTVGAPSRPLASRCRPTSGTPTPSHQPGEHHTRDPRTVWC
jgi:murein DD-endopeptidase MepM/ murein hydrolase activator NlpD